MKTYIIYLAAGNSERFRSNKLLFSYQGKPLYQYGLEQLDKLLQRRVDCEVIVVTQYQEILNSLQQKQTIKVVNSDQSKLGLSYSIQAGIEAIASTEPYYMMFVVADQPFINESTLSKMIDAALMEKPLVAAVHYRDRLGNPILFHSDLKAELLALTGDFGGRGIFRKYQKQAIIIEADDVKELQDIDIPEDVSEN